MTEIEKIVKSRADTFYFAYCLHSGVCSSDDLKQAILINLHLAGIYDLEPDKIEYALVSHIAKLACINELRKLRLIKRYNQAELPDVRYIEDDESFIDRMDTCGAVCVSYDMSKLLSERKYGILKGIVNQESQVKIARDLKISEARMSQLVKEIKSTVRQYMDDI